MTRTGSPAPLKRAASGIGLLLLLVAACGRPGPPRPPLRYDYPAETGLTLHQQGPEIVLRAALPVKTVEGVEVYRGAGKTTEARELTRTGDRAAVIPGPQVARGRVRFQEPAAPFLAGDPPTVTYALKVRLPNGKQFWSRPGTLDLFPFPAPPRDLALEHTETAVHLRWTPPPGDGAWAYRVYRAVNKEDFPPDPLHDAPLEATTYTDTDLTWDTRYRYLVRALDTGQATPVESENSPVVDVTHVDRFPPAPPAQLQGIAEAERVHLLWSPNTEEDLAGYHVYRTRDGGDRARLTETPLVTSTFTDREVRPGRAHAYTVTALDRADPPNESLPSDPVTLTP